MSESKWDTDTRTAITNTILVRMTAAPHALRPLIAMRSSVFRICNTNTEEKMQFVR